MKTSETIDELAKALSKMQGEMGPAIKDKKNPFFKSSYADLTSVWMAIREPLVENGLSVVQDAVTLEQGISVITRVLHVTGQWIEFGPLLVPVQKNDAQAVGSAISYGKRYALGAALGVVAEQDDDGNRAVKAAPKKQIDPVNLEEWYALMAKFYNIDDLKEYVKQSCVIMKKIEKDVINHLATLDHKRFNESFQRWKKIQDQEK